MSGYSRQRCNLGSPDDWQFLYDGEAVGRCYARRTPEGEAWHWTIYMLHARGTAERAQIVGDEPSLQDAQDAFKRNFERLIEVGILQPSRT